MAMYADLYADQGSNFTTVVSVGTGNAFDTNLTGYTARGKIRKSYASSSAYNFTVTVASPASAGQLLVALTAVETQAIKPGRYLYDIEIIQTSTGKVTRVLEGQIDFSPSVTSVITTVDTLDEPIIDGGVY